MYVSALSWMIAQTSPMGLSPAKKAPGLVRYDVEQRVIAVVDHGR